MTDFLSNLPAPTRSLTNNAITALDRSLASYALVSAPVTVQGAVASRVSQHASHKDALVKKGQSRPAPPPYGSRHGWLPRCLEDFEDGGAYPEIHIAQFPSNMGRSSSTPESSVVALQTSEDGKLEYDAVIKQNLSHRLAVHTKPDAMRPKWSASSDLQMPSEEAQEDNERRTKAALDAILSKKLSKGVAKSVNQEPEYIKYTPNEQAPGHNANCAQRIIRMVEAQVDPMELPKFRHKRIPRGAGSPPTAILHSPPRKLSAKDQEAWKIPPCISNWKNQKGYTIPLDKRLQADGRSLQDISINDKFASLSEALYIAERAAREEIRMRSELIKRKTEQEEALREAQLRDLAAKARAERAAVLRAQEDDETADTRSTIAASETRTDDGARISRRDIDRARRREIERDARLERAGKKSKTARDEGRDISEKVALGQAKPTSHTGLFDSRLFNQSAGMDSGYNAGDDEKYNVYDKPLFADRSRDGGGVYRFDRERMEQSIGEVASFAGADTHAGQTRTAPVEFEMDVEDPFGLDSLIASAVNRQKDSSKKK